MATSDTRAVDFAAVKRNASEDGIPLSEIAIKYEQLTPEEINALRERGLLTHSLPTSGNALGRFAENGDVLFPAKAVAVLHLAA